LLDRARSVTLPAMTLLRRMILLVPGVLVIAACGGDDGGSNDDTNATSSESVTETNGMTSTNGTSTNGTSTNGTTADTGSTTEPDDTTAGEDTEASTTDAEVCTIQLPPPGECGQNAPNAPKPFVARVGGPKGLARRGDLVVDDEPAQGGGFIDPPPPAEECDIWEQDCPDGQKCMPWDNSGQGSWNATKCTPLDPNPAQIGEACMVEGSGTSGVDNCELGSMCWAVDPETNVGHCIEMCSCTPDNPICQTANTFCSITNQGSLILCLPVCNPLDPDECGTGEGCYPIDESYFGCAPQAGDGDPGDACSFLNTCKHGTMCGSAAIVPGCNAAGCCTAFCTVGDDSACLAGQSCIPFYAAGTAPDPCLGEVGVCMVP
jgi:hypothetical protein